MKLYCSLSRLSLAVCFTLLSQVLHAQYVYKIKADTTIIYNTCDTAELVLKNRTQNVPGFLFNKGLGVTEFRRMQLLSLGDTALTNGQDTVLMHNIYNSNGTLTGNRTLNGNNHELRFDSLNSFYFSGRHYLDDGYGGRYLPYGMGMFDGFDSVTMAHQAGLRLMYSNTDELLFNQNSGLQYFVVNGELEASLSNSGLYVKNAYIPKLTTGVVNTSVINDMALLEVYNGTDSFPGLRIVDGHQAAGKVLTSDADGIATWQSISGVGGSSGGKDSSLYNSNGALTSDRVIAGNNYALSISSGNGFNVTGNYLTGGSTFDPNTLLPYEIGTSTSVNSISHGVESGLKISLGDSHQYFDMVGNINFVCGGTLSAVINPYGIQADNVNFQQAIIANGTANSFMAYNLFANSFVLTDGNQSQGRVLTSDGSGNATWQDLPASITSNDLTAHSFYQASLSTLKKGIENFDEPALPLLNAVKIKSFIYKDDKQNSRRFGILADSSDWHFATKEHNKFDVSSSLAISMKAIQELSQQNTALKEEVKTLEERLQKLEALVEKLAK